MTNRNNRKVLETTEKGETSIKETSTGVPDPKPVDVSEPVQVEISKKTGKPKRKCTPAQLEHLKKCREKKAKERNDYKEKTRYNAKRLESEDSTLRQILTRIDKMERAMPVRPPKEKIENPTPPVQEPEPVRLSEPVIEVEKKKPFKAEKEIEKAKPVSRYLELLNRKKK